jgi:hypothetical protein
MTVNTENFKREMMRSGTVSFAGRLSEAQSGLEKRYQEWVKTNPVGNLHREVRRLTSEFWLPASGPGALAGTDPMRGPIGC